MTDQQHQSEVDDERPGHAKAQSDAAVLLGVAAVIGAIATAVANGGLDGWWALVAILAGLATSVVIVLLRR